MPTYTGQRQEEPIIRGRTRGPYYYKAMQELGGVEDALGEMEESLKKNELKSIELKQRTSGCMPGNITRNVEKMGFGGRQAKKFDPETGYNISIVLNTII